MIKLFTVGKKGGCNGALWNGAHPEKFFPFIHKEGVKAIWDVRRIPNGQYGCFFDTEILKFCCKHEKIDFKWRIDFAPEKNVFQACRSGDWDLFTYAKAYFTPQIVAALNAVTSAETLDGVALLCAEQEIRHCHRQLIAEYFKAKFPQIELVHLGAAYDRDGNMKDATPRQVLHNTRVYIRQLIEGR